MYHCTRIFRLFPEAMDSGVRHATKRKTTDSIPWPCLALNALFRYIYHEKYWKVQWYNLFCPRGLGHDTRVTQSLHSILPCGALYKLDPLETKGLYLVRFSKGCVLKHFSVAIVEWSYTIKLRATHITLLVYILFCPRKVGSC